MISETLGNFLTMKIISSHLKFPEAKSLSVGPKNLCFSQFSMHQFEAVSYMDES